MNSKRKKTYVCCKAGKLSKKDNYSIVCSLMNQECPCYNIMSDFSSFEKCLCRDERTSKPKNRFKKLKLSKEERPMPKLVQKDSHSFVVKENDVYISFCEQDDEMGNIPNVYINGDQGLTFRRNTSDFVDACEFSISSLHEIKMRLKSLMKNVDSAMNRITKGMLEGKVAMSDEECEDLFPYDTQEDGSVVELNFLGEKKDDKVSENTEL